MSDMERRFTDDEAVEWTVREIANAAMPESLAKLIGPERRVSGWLLFTSTSRARRRLSPFPADWKTVSDFEMIRWLARAKPIPPAPTRRRQD